MEIIKKPIILKKPEYGNMKVRLVKVKFPKGMGYEIQYYDTNYNKWSSPDYGPGSEGWAFMNKKEALEFWDDMFKLSPQEMAKKYEEKGRWVS